MKDEINYKDDKYKSMGEKIVSFFILKSSIKYYNLIMNYM